MTVLGVETEKWPCDIIQALLASQSAGNTGNTVKSVPAKAPPTCTYVVEQTKGSCKHEIPKGKDLANAL